ncbi:MAG: CHASE2 domain-containing protein, partial [Gammaproteobacteria bacterium]|nr:CHASE2 domain-containing protein [Gammaproteobacteria bacterium]
MKLRHLLRVAISLVLLLLFAAHVYGRMPFRLLDKMEDYAYDARLRLTMPATLDPRIVIVDVDDQSLREQGQWPWPRDKLAGLVTKLFDRYHVRLVAFDVMFSEPDRSLDLALLDQLAAGPLKSDPAFQKAARTLRPQLERDRIFAASLQHRPAILGYVFSGRGNFTESGSSGRLPSPAITDVGARYPAVEFPQAVAYTGNLPVLADAAAGQGFYSNPYVDADGSFRRIGLLEEYRGNLYASLDLAVLQLLAGKAPLGFVFDTPVHDNADLDDIRIGDYRIPVDRHMAALVPYRGYVRSFPYVSAADVIEGKASRSILQNAIVYIGSSAAAEGDLRSTPVGAVFPGVEVHANFLSGVLDGRVKNAQPQYARGAQLLLLFMLAAVVIWVTMSRSILMSSAVTLALVVLITAGNLLLWQYGNFVFPLASPLLFLVVLFVLLSLYGYFIESRGKRHLSRMFSQYIPPQLVAEMDAQQGAYSMESDSRELTVMFADVRDFISISEGLGPRELSRLMNEYLTGMTRAIHTHRGTID